MLDNKIIFIDWGIYLHKSIFASKKVSMPPTYTALSMIIGDLKKVGVNLDDIVIIACDSHGKGHWRRDLDSSYKHTRKKKREDSGIDWETYFNLFDNLLNDLDLSTPFHIVEIDRLEADDIISAGCRYYKDKSVVIVSFDSDYEQLFLYPNVRIFSPKTKQYKRPINNPHALLQKKIQKEVADDLISPILTEKQYEIRKTIVSLLSLPDEIEQQVIERLSKLQTKTDWDIEKLPFYSLRKRFSEIYNTDNKIDYYKSITGRITKKSKKKTKKQQTLI